jgi:hypothetical protein
VLGANLRSHGRIALLLIAAAVGCDSAAQEVRLEVLAQHAVAEGAAPFHDVALVGAGAHLTALWSDASGLHARRGGPGGVPDGPAMRIGPPCRGGLDALGGDGTVWVSCLRPGDDGAALHALAPLTGEVRSWALGPAGRDGRGIALVTAGEHLHAIWHDGTPGAWRIRHGRVNPSKGTAHERPLSEASVTAEAPSLVAHRGRLLAAWMETTIEGNRPRGRIVLSRVGEVPRPVADVHWAHPMPRLATDARGVLLAYRDARADHSRPELYLQRIAPSLKAKGSAKRIARADGPGTPRIVRCGERLLTVAPRTWDRQRLIGVAPLGPDLTRTGREELLHELGIGYAHADATCTEKGLLLLVAEWGNGGRHRPRLRAHLLRLWSQ